MRPTILVTGAAGQIGFELARLLAPHGEVIAADRASLDLADPDAIVAAVRGAKPALIVNAGAYTAVDRAESEAALARAVNGRAPGILAEEAKRRGALLIHYSTDYVFDGAATTPYPEDAPTAPLNVYGATKLEGERAIAAAGGARARLPHELGVRPSRQEFPADGEAPRRRARRAFDRRRSDRRAQLVARARRGDRSRRRRRTCQRPPSARGCITCRRRAARAGTSSPRRSSGMRSIRASCRSRPPNTRPRRAARRTACSRRSASRRRSGSRWQSGARRSRAAWPATLSAAVHAEGGAWRRARRYRNPDVYSASAFICGSLIRAATVAMILPL